MHITEISPQESFKKKNQLEERDTQKLQYITRSTTKELQDSMGIPI